MGNLRLRPSSKHRSIKCSIGRSVDGEKWHSFFFFKLREQKNKHTLLGTSKGSKFTFQVHPTFPPFLFIFAGSPGSVSEDKEFSSVVQRCGDFSINYCIDSMSIQTAGPRGLCISKHLAERRML